MNEYVGRYGLAHYDFAMTLIKAMTTRFTSEFGIRFFLLADSEKTLALLNQWVKDKDYHVRRLVSEGTRPRLPWAMQLPMYIENPQPVIRLLEQLKDDPAEYVRRSVANNLNDIAKDHPDLVADLALSWMNGADINRQRLIQHACRTLLKQGHVKALQVFGFHELILQQTEVMVSTPTVKVGEALSFSVDLLSATNNEQNLMIDYVIHHQKKNGSMTPKVFKWKKLTLSTEQQKVTLAKTHSFKKVTTRTYHAGKHAVEVIVNGVSIGKAYFDVTL